MKGNVLRYRGYCAMPEYRPEDQVIYGYILGITDLVDFYSENAKDIEKEFHSAVDDYLDFCKEIEKKPQKAYSGSFNVRIDPELHRQAAIAAELSGTTLNKFVAEAIEKSLNEGKRMDEMARTAAITARCLANPLMLNKEAVEPNTLEQAESADSISTNYSLRVD